MAVVTIVMGSKSDYETVLPAYEILRKLGVDAEMKVMSAHRTPDEVAEFAKNAAESGVKLIVAAAGKAAHLAGFIAAHTVLPSSVCLSKAPRWTDWTACCPSFRCRTACPWQLWR